MIMLQVYRYWTFLAGLEAAGDNESEALLARRALIGIVRSVRYSLGQT